MADETKPEDQTPEIAPEATEEPAADPEDTEAPEGAEPTESPAADPAPAKADTVPLAKYMEERRRRQALEKQAREGEMRAAVERRTAELVERRWPADEAARLAVEQVGTEHRMRDLEERQFSATASGEIKELARSDDFFADAEAYADEIRETMQSKSVSAEDAYMLLRGRARTREMATVREQRAAATRRTGPSKKVESASPTAPKAGPKLDADDRKALAELQKVQPAAGWTPEKYAKMMGR